MKIANSLIVSLFALVIFSSSVLAYSDVSINLVSVTNSTCPCSTLTSQDLNIEVTNKGDTEETFSLSLILPSDEFGAWSGFVSPKITLESGETSGALPIFLTPSCEVVPGIYRVILEVESTTPGKTFSRDIYLNIRKCHFINIDTDKFDLCQGIELTREIEIFNEGYEDETIKLSSSVDWVDFPLDTFELRKGEKEVVDVKFSPPTDEEGIMDVTVTAKSLSSYAVGTEEMEVNIRKCYDAIHSVNPESLEICPCKVANFVLKIVNFGLLEDSYSISFMNQTKELIINPNETGDLEVSVFIPCDKKEGNYSVQISADSHTPEDLIVDVNVLPKDECYSVELAQMGQVKKSVGVGKAVTFEIIVKNKGMFNQEYKLILDAPEWMHISEDIADLGPSDEKKFYIYVAPQFFTTEGNYTGTVSALSTNERDTLELMVDVLTNFTFTGVPGEVIEDKPKLPEGPPMPPAEINKGDGNITINMSIPVTGLVVGSSDDTDEDKPWTQIVLITILALGVIIILILRFVVMIK